MSLCQYEELEMMKAEWEKVKMRLEDQNGVTSRIALSTMLTSLDTMLQADKGDCMWQRKVGECELENYERVFLLYNNSGYSVCYIEELDGGKILMDLH